MSPQAGSLCLLACWFFTSLAVGLARADDRAEPRASTAPACPLHRSKVAVNRRRPPSPVMPGGAMPDMFSRMAESFARNPAGGFFDFVHGLSDLEGPALEGIRLSLAEERTVGRQVRMEYLKRAADRGYPILDDKQKQRYIESLVERLSRRMKNRSRYPQIDVTLIDAPIADGQAFPGGSIVLTSALLDEPDEATVAGVVAHELAHLDLGHLYGYAKRSKLAEATYANMTNTPAGFDRFFERQFALFGLMMNPYRPEHESDADCNAATWLFREGYDPGALAGFFERLHRRIGDRPIDPNFAFGQSHPYSLDRRQHIRRRSEQLKRWQPQAELGLYPENLRDLRLKPPPAPELPPEDRSTRRRPLR